MRLILLLLAACVPTVAAGDIDLASDPNSFRANYVIYPFRDGSVTGATGFTSQATSTQGQVITNYTGTPTATYQDWDLSFGPGSDSSSFVLPVGLGSETFTLTLEVDGWRWTMEGPTEGEITQPTLGRFESEGFLYSDVAVEPLTGSWMLEGPTETVGGDFDFTPMPSPFGADEPFWTGLEIAPDELLRLDEMRFGYAPSLFVGEVDGIEFDVHFVTLKSIGSTLAVPEPTMATTLLLGIPLLLKRRRRVRGTR